MCRVVIRGSQAQGPAMLECTNGSTCGCLGQMSSTGSRTVSCRAIKVALQCTTCCVLRVSFPTTPANLPAAKGIDNTFAHSRRRCLVASVSRKRTDAVHLKMAHTRSGRDVKELLALADKGSSQASPRPRPPAHCHEAAPSRSCLSVPVSSAHATPMASRPDRTQWHRCTLTPLTHSIMSCARRPPRSRTSGERPSAAVHRPR